LQWITNLQSSTAHLFALYLIQRMILHHSSGLGSSILHALVSLFLLFRCAFQNCNSVNQNWTFYLRFHFIKKMSRFYCTSFDVSPLYTQMASYCIFSSFFPHFLRIEMRPNFAHWLQFLNISLQAAKFYILFASGQ
jgi:hypothetical protein